MKGLLFCLLLLMVCTEAQKGRGMRKGGKEKSRGRGGVRNPGATGSEGGSHDMGGLAGQDGRPCIGICFLRRLANLPPLDITWDKPCIGMCAWRRDQGQTREQYYAAEKAAALKKPCIGLCYTQKQADDAEQEG